MSIDKALRKARGLSPDEAEMLYREILERFPGNRRVVAALEALSAPPAGNPPAPEMDAIIALYAGGRLTQALDAATGLLARYPGSEILNNIAGVVLAALGRVDRAVAHYDRAVEIAPDYFEAYNNRGNALRDLGRLDEALASFGQAIRFNRDYAEAYMNRGITLGRLHRLDEALAAFDRAIQANPRIAEIYNNKGNVLLAMNRIADALPQFDKAVALKPEFADAFVNRGNALRALRQGERALANYNSAIALSPAHATAYRHRGALLRSLRRHDEALDSYRRALQLVPDSALTRAEIRNLEAHLCIWHDIDTDFALPAAQTEAIPPFYMLRAEDSLPRQLDCARAWRKAQWGAVSGQVPMRAASPDGKIRLGYFSADFHNHATMYLIARLFELHDRSRFEVHAFSYGPHVEDAMRARLLRGVDAFHPIGDVSDDAAAQLAWEQGIDIAIDLKGYTEDARPGIFARRAAPVQVSYLGYPGTMGAEFIDHIVADAVTIPPEWQRFYAEKVAYLPHCYQVNDDRRPIADRLFTRAELGLPEDGFVFCCFNNNYKITRAEFDIWMRLLARVEGSVLWLLKDNDGAADNLRREATKRGIDAGRLVFAERMPLPEHLARHRCADLFLDTFNVNAHTTASDSLWAGLPVLTKLGSSFVARVAGSLLHAIGLEDLATQSPAAYERLALDLATDPAKLAEVKARLARNRLTTPLFDTQRTTRDIEQLLERLHAESLGKG